MYIYALGITKHVEGTIAEPEDGQYVMTVASRDGTVAATLTNELPRKSGPRNTVDATFTSPLAARSINSCCG